MEYLRSVRKSGSGPHLISQKHRSSQAALLLEAQKKEELEHRKLMLQLQRERRELEALRIEQVQFE